MDYDFVEIGTSDFDTLIENAGKQRGLSVEPIPYYLDKLPDRENVTKVPWAISDQEGELEMWYISEENIKKYNLPNWVRGCNSLGGPHPTVLKLISHLIVEKEAGSVEVDGVGKGEEEGLGSGDREKGEDFFEKKIVLVKTFSQLADTYDIKSIGYLKIDTEGHDCTILESLIYCGGIFPKKICFETNSLTERKVYTAMMRKLVYLGYKIIYHGDDTILELGDDFSRRGNDLATYSTHSNTTLVTFFYPLEGRNIQTYFDNFRYLVALELPIVVFIDPKNLEKLQGIISDSRNIILVPYLFEEWDSYQYLDQAKEAFQEKMSSPKDSQEFQGKMSQGDFQGKISQGDFQGKMFSMKSSKYTPEYSVLTWCKFDAIREAMISNLFMTEKFAWIDFGCYHLREYNPNFGNKFLVEEEISNLGDLFSILRIAHQRENIKTNMHTLYACGFMAASDFIWNWIIPEFKGALQKNLEEGYASLEEQIIPDIIDQYPEKFSVRYGWYEGILFDPIRFKDIHERILIPGRHANDWKFNFEVSQYLLSRRNKLTYQELASFYDEYCLCLYYLDKKEELVKNLRIYKSLIPFSDNKERFLENYKWFANQK